MIPTIKVLKIGKIYKLYSVGGYCGIQPAGPRLLRLNPPAIQFEHTDEAAALKDAEKLQAHIDEWANSKAQKKNYHARVID